MQISGFMYIDLPTYWLLHKTVWARRIMGCKGSETTGKFKMGAGLYRSPSEWCLKTVCVSRTWRTRGMYTAMRSGYSHRYILNTALLWAETIYISITERLAWSLSYALTNPQREKQDRRKIGYKAPNYPIASCMDRDVAALCQNVQ